MKRLSKLLVNLLAILMVATCCLSLTACGEDIKRVELKVQLYDFEDGEFLAGSESTMAIDLYAHLAPETCKAMVSYINEGYYDNALIYKTSSQIMFGDLKVDGEAIEITEDGKVTNIVQNAIKPTIKGEFERGGTTGSNLTHKRGSVGLWRSYYASSGSYSTSAATNSGRATWFMPTETMTVYNNYFCVFGMIDFEDQVTEDVFEEIEALYSSSSNYTTFVIYYTGEYDATKVNSNYGLTFHCVTKDYYDQMEESELDQVFTAEGKQLVCYNKYEIKVANNADGKLGAIVKGATVK